MLTIFRSHAARRLRTFALYDIIMKFIFWFPRNLCLYFGVKKKTFTLTLCAGGSDDGVVSSTADSASKRLYFYLRLFSFQFLMSVKRTMSPTIRVWQRCRSVCFNDLRWYFVIIKHTIGINDDGYCL